MGGLVMKRIGILLLGMVLIASGCLQKPMSDEGKSATDPVSIDEQVVLPDLRMNEAIPSLVTNVSHKPALVIREFEAKVKPYTIAKDLANVKNIARFSGFTREQVEMLVQNGFVVLPSYDTKIYYAYDQNEYRGIPNFITVDSVLHTFHQFYNKSLMYIESSHLYDDLVLMTKQMLDKAILVDHVLVDPELKTLQQKNIVFFLVGNMLLDPQFVAPAGVSDAAVALAKQELALIEAANTFESSPLFGVDLDYSQFKVRGHYTRSAELGLFFKTMMWYGTVPLPFFDDRGNYLYGNTWQALLLTFTTFLQSEHTQDATLWTNIYIPTAQYVGLSDDIHVFTMNALREAVFGKGNDPNVFSKKEYADALLQAVKALPEPRIQAKFTAVTTPTKKQFRFMGQRYILDSFIMQELMMPIARPLPSGLDVMGVLGSDLAEHYIFDVLKPQETWPGYTEQYALLKEEVARYTTDTWGNNLYNGWLWTIQSALTEYDTESGMPFFMTTTAWKNKSLNAALGSYTELKHDTVLYGKQPAAEMGGALEIPHPRHYVEPNVVVYRKLLYLTDYTLRVLEERGMLNEEMRSGATQYKELLQFLIDVSIKQLRNEALTDEENDRLLWYGGTIEHIANAFRYGLADGAGLIDTDLSDMLVSDVATIAPNPLDAGGNLSLGTGYFDHIYVVVPAEDGLYLARGSVYSYYEFFSRKRLSDEEWWAMHGIKKIDEEYGSFLEWTAPSPALPEQPFWVQMFKSDRNDVEIELIEVDWDKLNE